MNEIIGYLTSFTLGFVASLLSNFPSIQLNKYFERKRANKPLNRILNFGREDDIVFVFTHRAFDKDALLPRTSTEDFMAVNNIKSALIKIGWKNKDLVRDAKTMQSRISDQKKKNILICRSKSNSYTKKIEDNLKTKNIRFYHGKFSEKSNEWVISDGKAEFPTKTHDQLIELRNAGVEQEAIPTKSYEDMAYITKITNEYNSKNKIFIIAGVRGLGTWGAAECLKKEYMQLYDNLPKNKKDCDFSALLTINYENMDITKITVENVIPINSI